MRPLFLVFGFIFLITLYPTTSVAEGIGNPSLEANYFSEWVNDDPELTAPVIAIYSNGKSRLIKVDDATLTVSQILRKNGLNSEDFKTESGVTVNPDARLISGNKYYFVPVADDVKYRTEALLPPDEVTESFFIPEGDKVVLSEGVEGRALFISKTVSGKLATGVTKNSVESVTILAAPESRRVLVGKAEGDSLGLVAPVEASVTSHYGYRTHPITGAHKMHKGTDFGSRCGVPVKSLTGGQVVDAGWRGGYGQQVRVDHGGGVETTYSHMSKILVTKGDSIKAGDSLGEVGSTGLSTGCHLHLEVFISGDRVNPYDLLVDNNLL